ncbi:hypothetical protein F5B19DRAFT_453159 [Rostrohypoxylon terebratum]|nr:hypothetical protein F5B19DRAFT_453159 [Rostrohypoxylon terebratum]
MYHKTAALSGLVAVTGVMAGGDTYSTSVPSVHTYQTSSYEASSSSYAASTSTYVAPYSPSHSSASHPASHGSYPANTTVATPVWQFYNTSVPTTVVVPVLTTVCPEATTLTFSGVHYTATKGQTITVTDCPCTITSMVPTITSSLCPPGVAPTAIAPGLPAGTTQTYAVPPAGTPAVISAVSAVSAASGSSPETAPGSPAPEASTTYAAAPTSASVSAVQTSTSSPTSVEISGAQSNFAGAGIALVAVLLGALAL